MNQNVIIIGATSGIGKNLALLFAQRGSHVTATGRRKQLLDELTQQFPHNITSSCFDITAENAIDEINSIIRRINKIDIFIYCAGIVKLTAYPKWESDKEMLHTNINAFTRCAGHVFNYFIEQGFGQMVVISSIAALRGGGSSPVYNASKAFQSSLCESYNIQAFQLHKNIVFTDVKPGYVKTDMAIGEKKFWVMPLEKTSKQVYKAILHRKRQVIVTNRWKIVGFFLKFLPGFLFLGLMRRNKT